jgi:hypothetical protein
MSSFFLSLSLYYCQLAANDSRDKSKDPIRRVALVGSGRTDSTSRRSILSACAKLVDVTCLYDTLRYDSAGGG